MYLQLVKYILMSIDSIIIQVTAIYNNFIKNQLS